MLSFHSKYINIMKENTKTEKRFLTHKTEKD